ncbi:MAG: citrate lyase holo-[Lachnospiraceae bacterium]|nr:citrate lyase holo-[acyl-carrier protein] synthase [Lachnospiraceae bacterium]
MDGKEITLPLMMDCRERRFNIQNELLKKYRKPVISFCMNIPGPIKTNDQIRAAFLEGKKRLIKSLKKHNYPVLEERDIHELTGDEWIASINADAEQVKELTMEIENWHPLGRLYDMDVIRTDGEKLSRSRFRKCLICGKQAQECARSRTHTVAEMQAAVVKMLSKHSV